MTSWGWTRVIIIWRTSEPWISLNVIETVIQRNSEFSWTRPISGSWRSGKNVCLEIHHFLHERFGTTDITIHNQLWYFWNITFPELLHSRVLFPSLTPPMWWSGRTLWPESHSQHCKGVIGKYLRTSSAKSTSASLWWDSIRLALITRAQMAPCNWALVDFPPSSNGGPSSSTSLSLSAKKTAVRLPPRPQWMELHLVLPPFEQLTTYTPPTFWRT